MATEYFSCMFAHSEDEFTVVVPPTYDYLNTSDAIGEIVSRKMEEGLLLQCLSKRNYLFYDIERIYEAAQKSGVGELKCLGFLTSHNYWMALKPSQVREIALVFENVLKFFKTEPKFILDALGADNYYSVDDFLADIEIARPSDYINCGDFPYVSNIIIYLLSVNVLFQEAAQKNLCIFYFFPQLISEENE